MVTTHMTAPAGTSRREVIEWLTHHLFLVLVVAAGLLVELVVLAVRQL